MSGWTMELGLLLLRGGLLLGVAFAVTRAFGRAPAALRHHVWTVAFVCLLALPLLVAAAPAWLVPLPIDVPATLTGDAAIGEAGGELALGAAAGAPFVDRAGTKPESAASAGAEALGPALERSRDSAPAFVARVADVPVATWIVLAWAIGALLLLGRLLFGSWKAKRLLRRAVVVTDREWTSLVAYLSLRSGLTTDVTLVRSPEVTVPMACGLFGSWLVLPAESQDWTEERRRVVVLHELAHLRRRDCLKQFLAEIALAVHWPNPLAWKALARMRAERERASDDAVLTAGTPGSEYANHLVEVARGLAAGPAPLRTAVAMARRSELEGRVLAILDERRARDLPSRRLYLAAAASLLVCVVPLAAVTPVSSPAPNSGAEEALSNPVQIPAPQQEADTDAPGDADAPGDVDREPTPTVRTHVQSIPRTQARAGSEVAADTIEEKVVRVLAGKLATGDVKMRRQAAQTLGMMEHPAAVPALMSAVTTDEDAGVRAKSAWALGMIESPEATEALASAAGDDSREVRIKSLWALGMIESPSGVEAIVRFLRDEDAEIRETAVWALGMIESSEAVGPLVEALAAERNAEVREQIAWALGMIESTSAVAPLMEAFRGEPEAEVREQIVWALGMIESREAAPTLVDALEDPDPDVSDQALWALGMVLN